MAQEAWGRWGGDDERGALNLIGAEQVRHAASLVKSGTVISLAQEVSSAMPTPAHRPGLMHFMNRDGGDYAAGARRPGGFQFAEDTVVMPLHVGTHIDALCHCWYEDRLYNGFSGNVVGSVKGAQRCGVETLPPIITRGVLVDLVQLTGELLPDGASVGPEMIEAALQRTGTRILPGDVVLLRTGWLEGRKAAAADFNREAGIDVASARLLAEAGAAVIGADNFAVEVLPFADGTVFPVHQLLIRDFGLPLLEGLVLEELARAGATTFLFAAAPLPIKGATGSPLTPVAIL